MASSDGAGAGAGRGRGQQLLARLKDAQARQQREEKPATPTSDLETATIRTTTTGTQSPSSDPSSSARLSAASGGRGRGLLARMGAMRMTTPIQTTTESSTFSSPSDFSSAPQMESSSESAAPIVMKGSGGKVIRCTANYIQLEVRPGGGIFEYEVKFKPPVDSLEERRRLLLDQQKDWLGAAREFDGVNLLLPRRLAEQTTVLTSHLTSSGQPVKVGIFFKKKKSFQDPKSVYVFNVLFNRIMRGLELVQMNRNFYNPAAAIPVEKHKIVIWPGYVTAVQEYEGGLHLQCDTTSRVLRTETALDVMQRILQTGAPDFKTLAEKELLGAVVLTKYNNKIYKIDDIDMTANPLSTFQNSNGEDIRFIDYYFNQYGIKIRDPKQPLLIHRPKLKSHHESDVEKLICLVPELCNLTGLTDKMRDDFFVMKDIGTHTRLTPNQRQAALKTFLDQIKNTPKAKEYLQGWGFTLADYTVHIDGRVLDSQLLHFGRGITEQVAPNADWTRTATSKPVLTAVNIDKWLVIFPEKLATLAQTFYKCMQQQGKRMGIDIALPQGKKIANDRTETYLKCIKESMTTDTQLVVTIFPQQRSDRYSAVKKLCYVDTPVASQVVLAKTLSNEKKLNAVVQKIVLQVTCKLGGELWAGRLNTPAKNIMIVGVDTFHDPTTRGASIAGVVSGLNDTFSRWHSSVCKQLPNQELVDALKIAFMKSLKFYHFTNHTWPSTIVVYRDGVGDGQLDTVAAHEVRQLKDCFKQCDPNYKPRFVFVVVQKRINTRIYYVPTNGDHENPPPGTVVDYHITRRNWYDFFLISQKVGQGTVTPTHFVVVDVANCGGNMPPDVIQQWSYMLTHMYYNWTGTVRVPAPCQYAHKLAAMVGENLHKEPNAQLEDKLFYL